MADIQVKRFWYAIKPIIWMLYLPTWFAYGLLMGWALTEGHNGLSLLLFLALCGAGAGLLARYCCKRWREWEGQ